jgi:uncharacterized protein (TIGR04255 family)
MALPRPLSRPPITEALVDFGFVSDEGLTSDRAQPLRQALAAEYPKAEEKRQLEAQFRVEAGKLLPPRARDLGFHGLFLRSDDATKLVQFRADGFTFNNVERYIGGEALLQEALRLWQLFLPVARPSAVKRVAMRYLNRLDLPLKEGEEFRDYLTSPPELPDEAPQRVSSFLSRIVAHDATGATAIVTQKLDTLRRPAPPVSVIIDVDVFFEEDLDPTAESLRPRLDRLRILKNEVFFSLLAEETVKLYI